MVCRRWRAFGWCHTCVLGYSLVFCTLALATSPARLTTMLVASSSACCFSCFQHSCQPYSHVSCAMVLSMPSSIQWARCIMFLCCPSICAYVCFHNGVWEEAYHPLLICFFFAATNVNLSVSMQVHRPVASFCVSIKVFTCTPCTIKKEPHIFVRRKQTSAYKLVQLSSFTGFCCCCWLAVLKYVVCLIFFANDDVKNCIIIYCLPRKGDGRSAQAWDTRLHPAVTLAFK